MDVQVTAFRSACRTALLSRSWPLEDIDSVVDEVLFAEACGKVTHGILALLRMLRGQTPQSATWTVESEGPAHVLIDGNGSSGSAVAATAVEIARSKAKRGLVAVVSVKNIMRYFTPGFYAYKLARDGFIGIIANTSTPEVVGIGGSKPVLGTNPIAIGIPAKPVPFLLDMATSQRAMGFLRFAKVAGIPIPDGVAVDADGHTTCDPALSAVLLPFGGYKGFGLALAIEAFINAATGNDPAKWISTERDWGYVFVAINAGLLEPKERLGERIGRLFNKLKERSATSGHDLRIPGEHSLYRYQRALCSGRLTVHEHLWHELEEFIQANKEYKGGNDEFNGTRCLAGAAQPGLHDIHGCAMLPPRWTD